MQILKSVRALRHKSRVPATQSIVEDRADAVRSRIPARQATSHVSPPSGLALTGLLSGLRLPLLIALVVCFLAASCPPVLAQTSGSCTAPYLSFNCSNAGYELSNAYDGAGGVIIVRCTTNCTNEPNSRRAFGSEVYDYTSSLCLAATHDGRLTNGGGLVWVMRMPKQRKFPGVTRFGVTTDTIDDSGFPRESFAFLSADCSSYVTPSFPTGTSGSAPWPMAGGNPLHNGRGYYVGPQNPRQSMWNYSITVGSVTVDSSSPAIGSTGHVYLGRTFESTVSRLRNRPGTNGGEIFSESSQGVRLPESVWQTPFVTNDIAYFSSSSGYVYSVNFLTGVRLWAFRATGATTPVTSVGDGSLYFGTNDGRLYSINATTGAFKWAFRAGQAITGAPAIVTENLSSLIWFADQSGVVNVITTLNGTLVSSFNVSAPVEGAVSIGPDGTVYVPSRTGEIFALRRVGQTITLLWKSRTSASLASRVSVAVGLDSQVYVGDAYGTVYAFHALTGKLRWVVANPSFNISASVTVGGDGTIYASFYSYPRSSQGPLSRMLSRVSAFRANGPLQLWSREIGNAPAFPSHPPSSPVLDAGGQVYVANGLGAILIMFDCPTGYFCPNASDPIPCPAGRFNPVRNANTSSACLSCTAAPGGFCPSASASDMLCQPGGYCPSNSSRVDCPAGRYNPSFGSVSVANCVLCTFFANGTGYCAAGSATNSEPCPVGYFCSNASAAVPCPAGRYCPSASVAPLACPDGSYSSGLSSGCETCPTECCDATTGSKKSCPFPKFWIMIIAIGSGVFLILAACTCCICYRRIQAYKVRSAEKRAKQQQIELEEQERRDQEEAEAKVRREQEEEEERRRAAEWARQMQIEQQARADREAVERQAQAEREAIEHRRRIEAEERAEAERKRIAQEKARIINEQHMQAVQAMSQRLCSGLEKDWIPYLERGLLWPELQAEGAVNTGPASFPALLQQRKNSLMQVFSEALRKSRRLFIPRTDKAAHVHKRRQISDQLLVGLGRFPNASAAELHVEISETLTAMKEQDRRDKLAKKKRSEEMKALQHSTLEIERLKQEQARISSERDAAHRRAQSETEMRMKAESDARVAVLAASYNSSTHLNSPRQSDDQDDSVQSSFARGTAKGAGIELGKRLIGNLFS